MRALPCVSPRLRGITPRTVIELVFWLWIVLTCAQLVIRSASGARPQHTLTRFEGTLVAVGDCSRPVRGRSEFSYTFTTPTGTATAHRGCPDEVRDPLARSVGKPVTVLFSMERDILFLPRVDVYELKAAETSFGGYAQRLSAGDAYGPYIAMFWTVFLAGGVYGAYRTLRSAASRGGPSP
jgi:hypothetical protein